MSPTLILAIVCMVTALAAYTLGVWGEKKAGTIRPLHLGAFWAGLLFDTLGTSSMTRIAQAEGVSGELNLHTVLGGLALVLMAVHAIWATVTYLRRDGAAMQTFHRFSLGVWGLWLVPFFSGLVLAMLK